MFTWKVPQAAGPSKPMDPKIIAKFVELYDAIFLQGNPEDVYLGRPSSAETVDRVKGIVDALMRQVAGQMEEGSSLKEDLLHVVETAERLEALSITLITFIRDTAFKSYRMFADRISRTEDLKAWLLAEAKKQNGGDILKYFDYLESKRRMAIQIVVDGLQGNLLSSLSAEGSSEKFIKEVGREYRDASSEKPKDVVSTLGPSQNIKFLEMPESGAYKDARYLPFFRGLYSQYRSTIAQVGISTTPTISVRNLPIAKTGADVTGPGGTNIPNFHFVDRDEDRADYFYGNDALLLESMTEKNGHKTAFERFSPYLTLNCGAQYDRGAKRSFDPLLNLAIGEKKRDFGEDLCLKELRRRALAEKELSSLRKNILGRAKKWHSAWLHPSAIRIRQILKEIAALSEDGLLDYLLYYNPWPDHFSHPKGPFSDEIISPSGELNRLDYWLGQISKVYTDAGLNSKLVWGMAGDHGLTPVFHILNQEVEVFDALNKEGWNLKVTKISSDEGEGPKPHPQKPPSMKNVDVIIASTAGGNYMINLFNSQDAQEWKVQPVYNDLLNWKTLEGRGLNIIEEIRSRLGDSLDYLAVAETPFSLELGGTVRLVSTQNDQRSEARVIRLKDRYFYESSGDLLGITTQSSYRDLSKRDLAVYQILLKVCYQTVTRDKPEAWCNQNQWRALSMFTDRPDSVVQLAHLFNAPRAGTINLFPRRGVGYNTQVPGRHAGESFHEKDAFLGFWGEPLRWVGSESSLQSKVIGVLTPTLYQYLTQERVEAGKDGWGFPSAFSSGF